MHQRLKAKNLNIIYDWMTVEIVCKKVIVKNRHENDNISKYNHCSCLVLGFLYTLNDLQSVTYTIFYLQAGCSSYAYFDTTAGSSVHCLSF